MVAVVDARVTSPLAELLLIGLGVLAAAFFVRVYRGTEAWLRAIGEARDRAWDEAAAHGPKDGTSR
jgi:hypothetical protein